MIKMILSFVLFFGSFAYAVPPKYSLEYDKYANPNDDLQKALVKAKKENKNILMIVGGDWCKWCGQLENFLDDHKRIKDQLYKGFEVVKVYYAKDMNQDAKNLLKQFPKVEETPFFYVLDKNAKLINIAKSSSFERGFSYNPKKFLKFIKENSGENYEK